MSRSERVLIVAGARTPIGSFASALRTLSAHELGARAASAAMERAGIAPETVGEVIMGRIGQVGLDAYNARRVALAAGLPVGTPAFNVNRLCGSGLQAIWSGAQELLWGNCRRPARRREREHEPDAVPRLQRALQRPPGRPHARRRHRRDADRSIQRHPHGCHRRQRCHAIRRIPSRSGPRASVAPRPRPLAQPSQKRSSPCCSEGRHPN